MDQHNFLTLGCGAAYLFVETDDNCLVVRGNDPGPSPIPAVCLQKEIKKTNINKIK